MISMVVWLLGLMLWAICEGITEAYTWSMRYRFDREEAGSVFLRSEFPSQGTYHWYRVWEIAGGLIMLLWANNNTWDWAEVFRLGFGSIAWAFLCYRVAFIHIRKQETVSPSWTWNVDIPGIGEKIIPYPPAWSVWLAGIAGFFVILYNFLG